MKDKRLFIVANRLPVCISEEDNRPSIKPNAGGLVSAIKSYVQNSNVQFSEIFWAGVPGCTPTVWNEAINHLQESAFTYLPIMVFKEQYEQYYNGFSNSVLWPLFHYFPSYAEYSQEEYEQYVLVNEHFAEILVRHCREGDTVWIHDYHLLPLAGMLRKHLPGITIGFFQHIPFPSYELFRLLPTKWQQDILNGMLGADLIGFHTIDYTAHFLQTVQMVLGLDNERNILRFKDRLIKVDVFPISIDYKTFHHAFDTENVVAMRETLKEKLNGRKVIFSVDRLDYTKGVHNRLKAYELFLKQNLQYHDKVVFIIVVVPSRDTIPKYIERKRMIDETISSINSHIGNIHWQPVIYQYNTLEFDHMVALYTACDLALITPLRDGMNLVAKEFVASRKDKKGVLIISEMAGAARELGDALTINPNDTFEMAQKIKEGLEMDEGEQCRRIENMQNRIEHYDINAWSEDFMTGLKNIRQKQQTFQEIFLDEYSRRGVSSTRRLIISVIIKPG
jgi:trehalose 6-phosphate synthase/phosphatase